MVDDHECGAVGGMRIGRRNRMLRENLPQCHFVNHTSHMTLSGIKPRAAVVGSRRLTAWAMTRPVSELLNEWMDDSLSLFSVALTLEHKASVKRFLSLQFPNPMTVGKTPLTGDQPVARPLPTHRTTQTQNKRRQTSMPWVGLEPTIPVFERAKTVHDLDRTATVTGRNGWLFRLISDWQVD
jgi:hypothetical protein